MFYHSVIHGLGFCICLLKDVSIKLFELLAAEHGTDRVETILDTKKNEERSVKVIGKNGILHICTDIIITVYE